MYNVHLPTPSFCIPTHSFLHSLLYTCSPTCLPIHLPPQLLPLYLYHFFFSFSSSRSSSPLLSLPLLFLPSAVYAKLTLRSFSDYSFAIIMVASISHSIQITPLMNIYECPSFRHEYYAAAWPNSPHIGHSSDRRVHIFFSAWIRASHNSQKIIIIFLLQKDTILLLYPNSIVELNWKH